MFIASVSVFVTETSWKTGIFRPNLRYHQFFSRLASWLAFKIYKSFGIASFPPSFFSWRPDSKSPWALRENLPYANFLKASRAVLGRVHSFACDWSPDAGHESSERLVTTEIFTLLVSLKVVFRFLLWTLLLKLKKLWKGKPILLSSCQFNTI